MASERVECFLLGARIHDHVDDMLWALEEIDESKNDVSAEIAGDMLDYLSEIAGREIDEAREKGCVPEEVSNLYDETTLYPSGEPKLREALYALSVRLGDPPGLRNLRRVKNVITSKPGGPPEERK